MKSWKNPKIWEEPGMPRKFIPLITALLIIWFIGPAFGQEDMQEIDNQQFSSPQRAPARFEHDSHNENAGLEDCNSCHHVYDDDGTFVEDESSEDQRCADCHDLSDDGRQPGLRKAYHQNCKGCHLEQQAGPVMCGECHIK